MKCRTCPYIEQIAEQIKEMKSNLSALEDRLSVLEGKQSLSDEKAKSTGHYMTLLLTAAVTTVMNALIKWLIPNQ